eukprot:2939542-Rhodomonas_salina.2
MSSSGWSTLAVSTPRDFGVANARQLSGASILGDASLFGAFRHLHVRAHRAHRLVAGGMRRKPLEQHEKPPAWGETA